MPIILSGPKFWGGNRGGRAGVIIELCVFNCLIFQLTFCFGGETEPLVGETHPAGLCADKPLLLHVCNLTVAVNIMVTTLSIVCTPTCTCSSLGCNDWSN